MSDAERNAIVIGVTGGIACGKSEVGRILDQMGFEVRDADFMAHDLMKKGTSVYHQLVQCFGKKILKDDGEISRPALGEIVFTDPDQRETLNRLVHPAVREALIEWIGKIRSSGKRAAVLIPLLFESGMGNLDWDALICVSSREHEVYQRLQNRGLSREEAEQRVRSQMLLEEKEKRANYIVSNVGTLEELELATRNVVEVIIGKGNYE